MGKSYASEKNAIGNCDRCGFRYMLRELRKERHDAHDRPLRVCPECWDEDHPQNRIAHQDFSDAQGLRNPRPDQGITESRYGDSVRFEFASTVEGWYGTKATLSHNSDGYVTLSWSATDDPQISITTTSVDADTYKIVRTRIRVNNRPSIASPWDGIFFWGASGFDSSRRVWVVEPDWSMGDPWVELKYDMSDEDDWTGTIAAMRFDFYGSNTVSTGSIDIDWIRVESAIL